MGSKFCPACAIDGNVVGFSKTADIYECPICRLRFLDSDRRGDAKNDNSWYSDLVGANTETIEVFIKTMEGPYTRQLDILGKLISGRKILDVGSGIGIYIYIAKKLGWEVDGCEESPYAEEFVKRHFSIVYRKFSAISPESYDAIRLSHVLEHIPEPVQFLEKIYGFLKPNGILLIIVPNCEPLLEFCMNKIRRLFSKRPRLAGAIYPDMHVLGFSVESLINLINRNKHYFVVKAQTVGMGNKTYYPLFYDGLLMKHWPKTLSQIRYEFIRLASQLGTPFNRGEWIVAYFRK